MTDDLAARLLEAAGVKPAPPVTFRPVPTIDELIPPQPAARFVGPDPAARELDQLVNEWHDHRAAAEKHKRQQDEAAALILTRMKPGQSHEIAPGVGVTIRNPSRIFDPAAAADLMTDEEIEACTITQLDPVKAKKILTGRHTIDQAMKPGTGKPSVVAL